MSSMITATPNLAARLQQWRNGLKWELEKQQVALSHHSGKWINGNDITPASEFTIGIVTYIIRFSIFKKVLSKIRQAFPGTRLIVAVNGYYKPYLQRRFLARLEAYLGGFADIDLVAHHKPQSLSKLWNEIILAAPTEKIFIVNDDIDVAPHFGTPFRASRILDREMAIINSSWSHFLISKRTIAQVGWFDERLFGIGGEDWDYEARLAFAGVPLDDVFLKGILNLSIYTTDFSFGENVERVEKKYTMSSAVFLQRKWQISGPRDPQARFVRIWNDYVRLNQGFETPVFYDFALLGREKAGTGTLSASGTG